MILISEGAAYETGLLEGRMAAKAIRNNIIGFWKSVDSRGFSPHLLSRKLEGAEIDEERADMIRGLSVGAGIPYNRVLGFNVFRGIIFPEECTMMMALGDSTVSGNTLYMKNSDKVGGPQLEGPKYHMHKEINVIRFEKHEGTKVIGVSAAGETGYKMGMNDKGVASGSNIARTTELKTKKLDLTKIRALDRAELLRRGMMHGSALSAAKAIANEIVENPMATPGNVHFADSKGVYLLEGSYDRVVSLVVSSGVAARANAFVVMKELNDPEDVSSQARYVRATRLLKDNAGALTLEKFVEFSQDHTNGTGPNSICRHGTDFRVETSLSAAVMDINHNDPSSSVIRIALGKPCRAWKSAPGNVSLSLKADVGDIPAGFREGDVWKEFYSEAPLAS